MIHAARNNLFIFNFPLKFIPEEIQQKYYNYVNRMPNAIDNVGDFVNATIQGVTFPVFSQEPVTQNQKGIDTSYRSSLPWQQNTTKDFEVTFQLVDGYLNYWILKDVFDHYYQFTDKVDFFIDPFTVYLLDSEGNYMSDIILKQIVFTGLSQLELSHADNIQEFKTFTCTFTFNQQDLRLPFD